MKPSRVYQRPTRIILSRSSDTLTTPGAAAVFHLAWPMILKAVFLHGTVVVDGLLVAPLGEIAIAAMGVACSCWRHSSGFHFCLFPCNANSISTGFWRRQRCISKVSPFYRNHDWHVSGPDGGDTHCDIWEIRNRKPCIQRTCGLLRHGHTSAFLQFSFSDNP